MSKIGKLLLNKGMVSEKQLRAAEILHQETGLALDEALVKQKALVEEDLVNLLAKHLQIPKIDPLQSEIPQQLLSILPVKEALKWRAIPVSFSVEKGQRYVHVALADPTQEAICAEFRSRLGERFSPCVAPASAISQAIHANYPTPSRNLKKSDDEELRALTRMVKAMRDLLIEKELVSAQELERALKKQK